MSEQVKLLKPTVAIVGGGPAGLSAAKKLAEADIGEILVLEREAEAGGIPRHSDHTGYGIRDRYRLMAGPAYARTLLRDARAAGASIMTHTSVTDWDDEKTLLATSPEGRLRIRPEVILFATGARERPRTARMIVGDRPEGVLTTGQLQNLVHINGDRVGNTAVVINAELVSWSAVLTLKQSGCNVKTLVSEYPKSESYRLFRTVGRWGLRTPVLTSSRVIRILGRGRVTGVEVEHKITGERGVIACDTVVFTGDWIADHELLQKAGIEMSASSGPAVDTAMQTSKEGVFAVGNVNHPVETADVVALEGQYVASRIVEYLRGHRPGAAALPIETAPPIKWIAPSFHLPGGFPPARGRLVAWVDQYIPRPTVTVFQGEKEIARRRLLWPAAPGRAFRIPSSLLKNAEAGCGPLRISLGS